MEVQSKNLVVKSNRLIEAGYKLTLQEQRIILFCITKIKPKEPLTTKTFCISASDYAEMFGIKAKNAYKELKETINSLYNRNVKIYNRESNVEGEFRWVQKKLYFNNDGYAEVTLTDELVPFLSELQETFTMYDIENVSGMKSVYAIRMYELLKQFKIFGKRKITLDWLKERLQIEGIYSAFADLKRRVIDPSLKEINEHSDLSVSYSLDKQNGRKVKEIEFSFHTKAMTSVNSDSTETLESTNLFNDLKNLGISQKQINQILKEYSKDAIQQAINITKHNIENKRIKRSVSGFLINAIKEGYNSYEMIKMSEAEETKKILKENEELATNQKKYENYVYNYVDNKIKEFSPQEKQYHIEVFLNQADKVVGQLYKKHGLEFKMVYSAFVKYIRALMLSTIKTKEQFFIENNIAQF